MPSRDNLPARRLVLARLLKMTPPERQLYWLRRNFNVRITVRTMQFGQEPEKWYSISVEPREPGAVWLFLATTDTAAEVIDCAWRVLAL